MTIRLERAGLGDAAEILRLQVASFRPLLEKYGDERTNPANDRLEDIVRRLRQPQTVYFFIVRGDSRIGAIRVVFEAESKRARISPMFIVPPYQGQGHGQRAIQLVEEEVGAARWELSTILEEEGNCRFYEKLGYRRGGGERHVNERMTLVDYTKETGG